MMKKKRSFHGVSYLATLEINCGNFGAKLTKKAIINRTAWHRRNWHHPADCSGKRSPSGKSVKCDSLMAVL